MMRKFALSTLLAALVAAGCATEATHGAGELTDRTKYPEGGYGVTEGSILAPLTFTGPDGPFSLDDHVFADGHNRVLLITTTAGWCTACKAEQPKLQALYEELSSYGFTIVAAMFEDDQYQPATPEQAASWKDRYKLGFPVVVDPATPDFQLAAYYDRQLTPMMMVVDVDTMKILSISTGWDEQLLRSKIEGNLDL